MSLFRNKNKEERMAWNPVLESTTKMQDRVADQKTPFVTAEEHFHSNAFGQRAILVEPNHPPRIIQVDMMGMGNSWALPYLDEATEADCMLGPSSPKVPVKNWVADFTTGTNASAWNISIVFDKRNRNKFEPIPEELNTSQSRHICGVTESEYDPACEALEPNRLIYAMQCNMAHLYEENRLKGRGYQFGEWYNGEPIPCDYIAGPFLITGMSAHMPTGLSDAQIQWYMNYFTQHDTKEVHEYAKEMLEGDLKKIRTRYMQWALKEDAKFKKFYNDLADHNEAQQKMDSRGWRGADLA